MAKISLEKDGRIASPVVLAGSGEATSFMLHVSELVAPHRKVCVLLARDMQLATDIESELAVYFASALSSDPRTDILACEQEFIRLLGLKQVRSIIIYNDRYKPPPFLRDDKGLNVLRSYRPEAGPSRMKEGSTDFQPQELHDLPYGCRAQTIAKDILHFAPT